MKKILILAFFTVLALPFFGQSVTISGKVTDSKSGETCISASVYDELTRNGTVTNNYGYYAIRVSTGNVKLVCSYVGSTPVTLDFYATKDTVIDFGLETSINLEEVIVTDKGPQQRLESSQMSQIDMKVADIKSAPALLGETDVIKTLQLMPGVQGGTEGSAGFFVRGGAPDQNLILLDGVPVYNVNHLFGFFSVFNADAIKNVTLIKGGFPAHYGGRLSSVVDIRMKEGNMKEFHGVASIGLISSNFTLEGPIKKDKTSFILSGRRTYYDLLTYPIQKAVNSSPMNEGSEFYAGLYFYDLNAKINHIISPKDRIYLSAYLGKDKFYTNSKYEYSEENYTSRSKDKAGIWWGNVTTSLRWNHQFSNRLFSNLTASFSDYTFDTYYNSDYYSYSNGEEDGEKSTLDYYSRIRDFGLKYDFDLPLNNKNYLRFGISNTLHTFSPGVGEFSQDFNEDSWDYDTTIGTRNIPGNEFYAYLEDEIEISKSIKVNLGGHLSVFSIKDKTYISPEPRFSMRLMASDHLSVKASYVWMSQYINLLTNTTIGLPTDLWIPSTAKLLPQKAWQTALGLSYNLNNNYEFTLEGYYKKMDNLVEYGEGFGFFSMGVNELDELTEQGSGESYGAEFMVQKGVGKFRGWISYTLSWSNRRFDEISFGKEFPFSYDRRHNIAIVSTYDITKNISLGASWQFYSGNAFTLPDELSLSPYWAEMTQNHRTMENLFDETVNYDGYFETRNNYRMPTYHRLDVGLNFTKQKKHGVRTWSIGAYNAYNRKNAFMVYQDEKWDSEKQELVPVLKQVTIFPVIPYFKYTFKF